MAKTVIRGQFYLFDKRKAGEQREVGAGLGEVEARRRVINGGDVYTLFKQDAYALAMTAYGKRALLELPHGDGFFSHYHPGGVHPEYVEGHPKAKKTPGHVFFGDRDERWSVGQGSAFRRDSSKA